MVVTAPRLDPHCLERARSTLSIKDNMPNLVEEPSTIFRSWRIAMMLLDIQHHAAAVRASWCAKIAIHNPSVAARPPIRNTTE